MGRCCIVHTDREHTDNACTADRLCCPRCPERWHPDHPDGIDCAQTVTPLPPLPKRIIETVTTTIVEPLTARDRERVGMLVHSALDQLWMASPDSAPGSGAVDPDDHLGCCPECCAPCLVVAELLEQGRLDRWVLWWPESLPGTSWWDVASMRVDRGWLDRAWAAARDGRLGCVHDSDLD